MKKWKNINWILIIVCLSTACQEDDEAPQETLLLGSWNLDQQSIKQVTVSSGENELTLTEEEFIQYLAISHQDMNVDEIRLFSDNTSFVFDEDQTYSIESDGVRDPMLGEWSLDDDQSRLTLQVGSESLLLDVISISRNQMQATFTLDEIDEGTRYQIDFIFTFTK